MEIVIKNKGEEIQKCVLFSYYDRCFKAYKAKNDFLNLDTGVEKVIDNMIHLQDDIEIYIDGEKSEEKRLEFLKKLQQEVFKFDHIELHVSDSSNNHNWRIMQTDANGSVFIKYIFSGIYTDPNQETISPIKIKDEKIKGIDSQTAYLFHVKPNQEWKLKFIQ